MSESRLSENVFIGDDSFFFDSSDVETLNPDLYNPGHFSMFDVLSHLSQHGLFQLNYHFDISMNTHVIDSINGEPHWWYLAYYHQGSHEQNIVRMDHYLWKEGATFKLYKSEPRFLEKMYFLYRDEVTRRKENHGKLILPKIIVRGKTSSREFKEIEIVPYNMIKDIYKEGTTTVLDVLMTLKDQHGLECDIKWFKKYGKAVINDYWLISIDGDRFAGKAGWAYEVGSFKYWRGLYRPHIPIGSRVLVAPYYIVVT